ncbi:conserved hypothetical protein [Uncinocarpus reesii 1704]|uniref:Tetratricopeptide repeat protein 1 n=1 Tax=Uncinocarpus reesii (strain UAMH 1704) TaxID=336963 RepID=C4JMU8_UNCRE|nr:uncharacterized protein UREG_04156 [Uncinocarpus reesii 1704]EEP79310.1 conserved hypothetical protein [Uncinocarpus reesii 1704]
MASVRNGYVNGTTVAVENAIDAFSAKPRFSDIPSAIDIPASSFDTEVEISLEELPEDPTELCTLLDNEQASKNFWVIIALAYAKHNQLDLSIEILNRGIASLPHGASNEKLGLLSWICWIYLLKSRQAPRVAPEGQLLSEARTKDYYLQAATATVNEAYRLNPAFPPFFLARGVLSLLRASLQPPAKAVVQGRTTCSDESKVANILLAAYYLHDSSRHSTTDPSFGSLYKLAMTQYTQKAFKLDKEYPMTCAMFGGYFLLRRHFPTVEALARKAIELTDVNAIASDGWYLLARKEHEEGDPAKAQEYYNRADQARGGSDKGYLPAKFGAVQMQIRSQDKDGAKFRLEKIVQQKKNPEAMTLLGSLYAEEVFEVANSANKEDKSAEIKKATSLLEAVRASWKDEKKKISPDISVLLYLARLYETTAPEKSMQCLSQIEQIQLAQIPDSDKPDDVEGEEAMTNILRERLAPQLLNNMGCFLYQADKIEQARNMFQTALNACVKTQEKDDGTDTDALVTTISYNLGRTYEAAGLPEEAEKVYEGLLKRHGDYSEANARLTYMSLRQSPTDEGPKKMAKLYEADATNLEVRALFGWYLNKSKRRTANIAEDHEQRHYKHTLLGYDKHDRYALTGMGNVHLMAARDMRRDGEQDRERRRKMYDRAVEFFDKALQLDPKNAYAAQGIAIALVDDKKDFSTAVQIFSKVRDSIRDASVYLNLGHVFAELRQFSKSIENILSCLGRVWFLKGKQERSIASMKTALEYAQRARSVAPEQKHLDFNLAFVQNEIAHLASNLPETQKTSQEIEEALGGLEEAVATFEKIAKAPNPPYPPISLEQRANMIKNTTINQLQRALQSQKEYEEKNAAKLQQAREAREAEQKRREEERRKLEEAEAERKRQIAEERQRMVEEAQRLAAIRTEEEKAREAAEYTTDSETGDKIKRKKRPSGAKRKKKGEDGEERETSRKSRAKSTTSSRTPATSDAEDQPAPRKRRRLGRRSTAKSNKYKSSEIVVESETDEGEAVPTPDEDQPIEKAEDEEMGDVGDAEQEDEDAMVSRRRKKVNLRIEDEEDEDEDEGDVAPAPADEQDDLFGEKSASEENEAKAGGDADLDTEMRDQGDED